MSHPNTILNDTHQRAALPNIGSRAVTIDEIQKVLTLVNRYDVSYVMHRGTRMSETDEGTYVKYEDVIRAMKYVTSPQA